MCVWDKDGRSRHGNCVKHHISVMVAILISQVSFEKSQFSSIYIPVSLNGSYVVPWNTISVAFHRNMKSLWYFSLLAKTF